jgi:hypothetical protein
MIYTGKNLAPIPRYFVDPSTYTSLRAHTDYRPVASASFAINYFIPTPGGCRRTSPGSSETWAGRVWPTKRTQPRGAYGNVQQRLTNRP